MPRSLLIPTTALLIAAAAVGQTESQEAKARYVCPPCPVRCHEKIYDAPGTCENERCHMTLIALPKPRKVAILLWNGVELLDFAGPGEVFASTRLAGEFSYEVYTVAADAKPITSQGFVSINPRYTIENAPTPDILVVPGGGTSQPLESPKVLAWVKKCWNNSEIVMSVCTGAFVLAKAGLLDDAEATTYHRAIGALRTAAPKTTVHENRRFVDNGDVITTAGVSAGIDGALHVVARLQGLDVAEATARYMEYEWRPQSNSPNEPGQPD